MNDYTHCYLLFTYMCIRLCTVSLWCQQLLYIGGHLKTQYLVENTLHIIMFAICIAYTIQHHTKKSHDFGAKMTDTKGNKGDATGKKGLGTVQ
jgi:hypothetical protein